MNIDKGVYEISLWKKKNSIIKKQVSNNTILSNGQLAYVKRSDGSYYNVSVGMTDGALSSIKILANQDEKNTNLMSSTGTLDYPLNLADTYTFSFLRTSTGAQSVVGSYLSSTGVASIATIATIPSGITSGCVVFQTTDKVFTSVTIPGAITWMCLYHGNYPSISLDYMPQRGSLITSNFPALSTDVTIQDGVKYRILGKNDIAFLGKSFNNKLKTNINGSVTFSFSLPQKYLDKSTGKLKKNEIVDEIFNESIIKLFFKNKWREFRVKNITKSREGMIVSNNYECEESFIEELSKQGYGLVFNEENGIGTIDELGTALFKNSGWTYIPVSTSDFIEKRKQYKRNADGTFYLNPDTGLPEKEEVIVSLPVTIYDTVLGRYVEEYTATGHSEKIYGYDSSETITGEIAQNLITANENFIDTSGWDVDTNPPTFYSEKNGSNYYLKIKGTSGQYVKNTTTQKAPQPIVAGEKYALYVDASSAIEVSLVSGVTTLTTQTITSGVKVFVPESGATGFTTKVALTTTNSSLKKIGIFKIVSKDKINQDYANKIAALTNNQSIALSTLETFALSPYDQSYSDAYVVEKTYFYKKDENGQPIYLNLDNANPQKVMRENSQKVRTLTASKSSRFNIAQDICELFEGWPIFSIAFNDDGSVQRDAFGNIIKTVQFSEQAGKENGYGFHYQKNVPTNQRTIDSAAIVTKMFVEKNDTSNSEIGTVSISQASPTLNVSGEDYIFNFDYYMQIGEIDATTLLKDLYGTTSGDLGYLTKLGKLNSQYDDLTQLIVDLTSTVSTLETRKSYLELSISTLNQQIADTNAHLAKPNTSDKITELNNTLSQLNSQKTSFSTELSTVSANFDSYSEKLETAQSQQDSILKQKTALDETFSTLYSEFLFEGSWQDSTYLTPNEFYLDALEVSERSAYPEVSYTFSVVDIPQADYEVGDKTFITDGEMFGYDKNGALILQDVTISEIEEDLDDPSKDSVTVQNYKTQFEDLFSRIAASSQTIQYNEGTYDRAASGFTPNGQIDVSILQNTLASNNVVLTNAKNQNFKIDDNGIEIVDLLNTSQVLKAVAGGIFLSPDGGSSWTTGITAGGLNASAINTGKLNVEKVEIFLGSIPAFSWDARGLNAYRVYTQNGATMVSDSQFVRYDQHGLYFTKNGAAFADVTTSEGLAPWYTTSRTWEQEIDYVRDNSQVSITWLGLKLKSDNGSIQMDTADNNIKIFDNQNLRLTLGDTGSKTVYYYNNHLTQVNTGTAQSPNWIEGVNKGNIASDTELSTAISGQHELGDYYVATGNSYSTSGFTSLKQGDCIIATAGSSQSTDWKVSKKILSEVATNYGLTVWDDSDIISLQTSSTGTLWLKNSLFVGQNEANPYFGIEAYRNSEIEAVLWIGNDVNGYQFSVNGKGELVAKKATIYGDVFADNGYFNGVVNATSGSFSGDIFASIGNIEKAIFIGATRDDEGNIVSYNSGIAASADYPNAIWINNNVFTVNHNGKLTASDADITGNINVSSGSITGKLNIGNGAIYLNGNESENDRFTIKDPNQNVTFQILKDGSVSAENIKIGNEASISGSIVLDDSCALINDKNNNYTIVAGSYSGISLKQLLNSIKNSSFANLDTARKNLEQASNFTLDKNGNVIIKGSDNKIYGNLTILTSYTNGVATKGQLKVGNIWIGTHEDGVGEISATLPGSSISSWKITDAGDATFNNAFINGELQVTRFVYDEIQTASGTILVAPSFRLKSISASATMFTLNIEECDFEVGTYFCIQGRVGESKNKLYGFITSKSSTDPSIFYASNLYYQEIQTLTTSALESVSKTSFSGEPFVNGVVVELATASKSITPIAINAMSKNVVGQASAITFIENKKIVDETDSSLFYYKKMPRLILGNLDGISELSNFIGTDSSYGLYSDNAYLKGTITTGSSGITTKAQNNVVIWAGGDLTKISSDIHDALPDGAPKFYVKDDGTMRAENGFFKGVIETTDAIISGRIINNGLKVDGMSKGIKFISNVDGEQRDIHSSPIASGNVSGIIDASGLDLYNGGDLRIYGSNVLFKDDVEKETALIGKIPYLFSNDTIETIFSRGISTFAPSASLMETNGLLFESNTISFKKSTPTTTDFNMQANTWFRSDSLSVISFTDSAIIFSNTEDYTSKNSVSVSSGLLAANKLVAEEVKANSSFGISDGANLVPRYETVDGVKVQDGFNIFFN